MSVGFPGTWNFSEAGHGKGAPDGIGATVKRLADRLVLRGTDIPDAVTMFEKLQPHTSVALYLVSKDAILERTQHLAKHNLVPVPGTMTIHQLICIAPDTMTMYHRKLSCMCKANTMCDCFAPTVFTFRDLGLPVASKDTVGTAMGVGSFELDSHVVVSYDGAPYPGLVVDTDNADVQVKCMHRVGDNRFYWPMRDDVCWYGPDAILAVIPAPQPVTSRHFCIDASIWKQVTA